MEVYECPSEPNYVQLMVNGMSFRVNKGSLSSEDHIEKAPSQSVPDDFTISVQFPASLTGEVIGKQKCHLNALREQTKARIYINYGMDFNYFIVSSVCQEGLDSAVEQVKAHINDVISKQKFTHFVAIPCVTDTKFKDSIRGCINQIKRVSVLSQEAYNNLERLHITMVLLKLYDQQSIDKASAIIEEIVKSFNWSYKNSIEIAGINTFSHNESNDVFYAALRGSDETEALKRLQMEISAALKEKGIDVVSDSDTFHVTVLRSSWMKGGSSIGMKALAIAANASVLPAPIESVALCRRFTAPAGQFYDTEVVVPLTTNKK